MSLFWSVRLRFGCGLLAFVLASGTIGFMLIEGWTPLQALYTAVLVVSTLGFSDLRPSDAPGQVLTIGLILLGVGTLYYLVGETFDGDLILLSIATKRYLRVDTTGRIVADSPGPRPDGQDGVRFQWQIARQPPG